ncbi:MAG: hypothetical protein WDM86_01205 [Rhizomicrobium sp.]
MCASADKLITGAAVLLFVTVATVSPAKAEALECKDTILNEPAFHLRTDVQNSTVTLEPTPSSFIAPQGIYTLPAQQANGALKWAMPHALGTLEFVLDGKTGAVTVDRLSSGRRENYAGFSCTKATDTSPQT